MNERLPTQADLERIPIRAIVAYSARTARRLSNELRGIIDDDLIDNLLDGVDEVYTTPFLSSIDSSELANAGARIAGAMSEIQTTHDKTLIASSLRLCAMVALMASEAEFEPTHLHRCASKAAKWAELLVSRVSVLEPSKSATIASLAIRDYGILLNEFGNAPGVLVNAPIHCFED